MISAETRFLSVRELGERIKAKQLSPVELTEAYLERGRTVGARLNAYATLTPDLAMHQARAAEAEIKAGKYRGPLHGIPYAAKDLLAVKGYPTQWGARPYANQKFDQDATVIKRLEQAGAVLLGKAAMIELAGGMDTVSPRLRSAARRRILGMKDAGHVARLPARAPSFPQDSRHSPSAPRLGDRSCARPHSTESVGCARRTDA